jgi:hypothetical protein
VATNLETRVAALEGGTGGGGDDEFPPCPECGWGSDGDTPYEIVFAGEELETPQFCATCGRQIPDIWFEDVDPQREEHRKRWR